MFDCGDGSNGLMDVDEAIERPSSDEEDKRNDIDTPIASHDGHAVTAARMHVIACIQGKHHCQHAPHTQLHHNRQMHAVWDSQMPSLVDAYLRWKHNDPNQVGTDQPQVSGLMFHVSTIDVAYKQPNEPLLYPARLDSVDGKNSLKHINDSGHADKRVFNSSYLILPVDVEVFKDDVQLHPGTHMATDNAETSNLEPSDESVCTENWKAVNTISDKTIDVFDQTGVFISQFLYQNYKQALDIIDNLTPVVEKLKIQLRIMDTNFEHWNIEELEYLESLLTEQEYDPQKIVYVEALQSLTKAEAEYGGITSGPVSINSGLWKQAQVATKVWEAERQVMHNKLPTFNECHT
ncbi:uncharacterized protein EDB91DRAFT_1254360 [Suillus paluster]|uniref:uncharacterized protein n=1 Tax=Suillus paluster TaxID=48578 RepID=UPI001B873134|nr:uncharacterized protein EDB91DRAFT_1254360 [Suillus paluster]KAG1726346.1 hypothetical protein EDB91DRAFT_1254360 [Suillus paluster]